MRSPALALLLSLLIPLAAPAGPVGRVEVLQGKAVRVPAEGKQRALKVGATVELGDTVRVDRGNLKLRLTDGSVLMLGEKAQLRLEAAEFQSLERKRFGATLLAGSLWARVKKALAGSERNFEITTERAVAGVRGTEFRVDVRFLDGQSFTRVSVWEGQVYVRGTVQAPRMSVAMDTAGMRPPDAVVSGVRAGKAAGMGQSRELKAVPAERSEEMPSRSRRAAAAPPAAAPAAPPIASRVERVLELGSGEAVLVGPEDDWQPDPALRGQDPLSRFATNQKK